MENKELLQIMEKCGHFLYHRRGLKRGQLRILWLLNERGAITQKELLGFLFMKSGSLSETISKLEAQAFIVKERSKDDKRKINISITPEGRDFLNTQLAVNKEQERVLFTALNSEEQAELSKLLTKLLEDWQSKFDSSLFFNHRRGM